MRDIPESESTICRRLRPILSALPLQAAIDSTDAFREALSSLEWFLPDVLQETHPEWRNESLDGICPSIARKTGDNEIEIIGVCILISDQTMTPLHVRLQLDPVEDAVSWLECRLGKSTPEGMLRVPYTHEFEMKGLHVLNRLDSVDWAYHVGFGERRN